MTATKPKGLFPKLSAAISEVERVHKDGTNSFHKYTYTSAEQIYKVIRKPLNDQGLIVIPSVDRSERLMEPVGKGQGRATVTRLHMRIVDSESGETLDAYWVGEGQDSGDKSPYKAATGGMKTWLKHLFLLPADDDPEADGSVDQPQKKPRGKGSAKKQLSRPQVLARLLTDQQVTGIDLDRVREWIANPDGKAEPGRVEEAIELLETDRKADLLQLIEVPF